MHSLCNVNHLGNQKAEQAVATNMVNRNVVNKMGVIIIRKLKSSEDIRNA